MNHEKQNSNPNIIDHVPSSEELQAAQTLQDTEHEQTQRIGLPEHEESQRLLQGPRQTGSIDLPNGNTVVHEVTADGMKQSRTVSNTPRGPRYKSAREFHDAMGLTNPSPMEQMQEPTSRLKRITKFVIDKAKK